MSTMNVLLVWERCHGLKTPYLGEWEIVLNGTKSLSCLIIYISRKEKSDWFLSVSGKAGNSVHTYW